MIRVNLLQPRKMRTRKRRRSYHQASLDAYVTILRVRAVDKNIPLDRPRRCVPAEIRTLPLFV